MMENRRTEEENIIKDLLKKYFQTKKRTKLHCN